MRKYPGPVAQWPTTECIECGCELEEDDVRTCKACTPAFRRVAVLINKRLRHLITSNNDLDKRYL